MSEKAIETETWPFPEVMLLFFIFVVYFQRTYLEFSIGFVNSSFNIALMSVGTYKDSIIEQKIVSRD